MSEWQFVGFIPQGPKGDRYLLTAQREEPNSYVTLYGQLQVWNVETESYVNEGVVEEFTRLYDGWVQVGFWLPYMEHDAQAATITFWRQWYCRVASDSNTFIPEGDPENMGTANLPVGPQGERGDPGGYYLITSSNPADHVAEFYRWYHEWDPVEQQWEPVGEIELFGGVVAPMGPEGRVGDYYLLTADNPPGEESTVRLFRQRRHGVSGAALGDPEQIGQAVAVQGPPGPQGEQGPPGTSGALTPQYGWQDVSEWQRLGFLAEKFIGWVSETIVNQQEMRSWQQDAVALFGSAAAGAVGGSFAGPPGAAAGAIVGLGVATMTLISAGIDVANYLPYKQEAARLQMAQALYCSLIPYRDLSAASVEAWVTANETLPVDSNAIYADPGAAARGFLARHWREVGISRAQEEMMGYFLAYWYNPAFDYSSLPCTPDIGDDQQVFDFTIDAQGWVNWTDYGGPFGFYQQGVGWHGEPRSGEGDVVGIKYDFGEAKTITHVEILYDLAAKSSIVGQPGVHFGVVGANFDYTPEPTLGENQVWTRQNPGTGQVFGLWFSPWAFNAGLYVKRISVTFAE